jgi:hypothetical protein
MRFSWSAVNHWSIGVLLALLSLHDGAAYALENPVRIEVGSVSGLPVSRQLLPVTVHTDVALSGAQNDLLFPSQATLPVRPNGSPFCAAGSGLPVDSDVSFRFLPDGCTRGVDCTGVRAVVIAPDGATIADGAELYTCEFQVTPLAAPGTYPIEPANLGASDPSGSPLEVTGVAGTLTVEQGVSATIRAGQALGMPGTRQTLYVTLSTSVDVGSTLNDLRFDLQTPIAANLNGQPDCIPGPNVPAQDAASFAFRPPECTPGVDCTAIRALIFESDNTEPIPDGSVLYSCVIDIAATAAYDRYPLTVANAQAANLEGDPLPSGGEDGSVLVFDEFSAQVELETVHGAAGERVTVGATLHTDTPVSGIQNDVAFSPSAPIAARENGRPACSVGQDIPLGGSSFSFLPAGCTPGDDCTGARALVLTLDNIGIPDGTLLYSCEIAIPGDSAPGTYPLAVSDVLAADPDGMSVPADGADGAVIVDAPTPTATIALSPHATETRTPPPTVTPTGTSPRGGSSGSCTVAAADPGPAWWLLLPLLVLRRRARRR